MVSKFALMTDRPKYFNGVSLFSPSNAMHFQASKEQGTDKLNAHPISKIRDGRKR